MKPVTCKILGFCLASAVTAVAWIVFWPRTVSIAAPPLLAPETVIAEAPWSNERIASSISAVERADSVETKLNAGTDLLQIPLAGVREFLERANLKKGDRLSLVAKILLIRWAADDGEAALQWAWKRFRSEGLWDEAFREIAPAWAAHNPAGLGKWALLVAEKLKPDSEEPRLAEVEAMELPAMDSSKLTEIANWLVTEDPRLAYQLVKRRGGFSSDDAKMPLALTSVAKVQEALTVFDDLKITDPTRLSGNEVHLYYLLTRWHELDPDDFNRSTYAGSIITNTVEKSAEAVERWKVLPASERADAASSLVASVIPKARGWRISAIAEAWAETDPDAAVRWLDSLPQENEISASAARISALSAHDLKATLDWADQLPVGETRQNSLVTAFDGWIKAHPGEHADRSGWPAARAQAWEELESLHTGK
ncbi:MAG: hypothetical protein V4819_25500 [Verrucomicrobiota bacterium]